MALEKWLIRPGESRVIDTGIVRSLKVALVGGQIDVIGHDEDSARVEVHEVAGKELLVQIDGDHLEIDHPQLRWENFLDVFSQFGSNRAKAVVSVLVPRDIALTFGVVTADALVSGLDTSAKLSTVGGELQVDSLTGDLELNAVSGDVSVQDHAGAVDVHTVSGEITVSGDVTAFDSDSISGDVFLDASGHCDRVRANSVSGDVTVRIDAEPGVRYAVNSVSGRIQVDGRSITGMRGRGYAEAVPGTDPFFVDVTVNTVSGGVTVLRRASATGAPAGAEGEAAR